MQPSANTTTPFTAIHWLETTMPTPLLIAPAANDWRSMNSLVDAVERQMQNHHMQPDRTNTRRAVGGGIDAALVKALLLD